MLITNSQPEYLHSEVTVSWILSSLFEKTISAFFLGSNAFEHTRKWIVFGIFSATQHKQIAFDFTDLQPSLTYTDILKLYDSFSRKPYQVQLKVREHFLNVSPRFEQIYQLKTLGGKNLGHLRVAECSTEQLSSPVAFIAPQDYLRKNHLVKLKLRTHMTLSENPHEVNNALLINAQQVWGIRLRTEAGKVLLDILSERKEAIMQDNQYLGISVDLGTLEIPIEDLLKLRVGTTLEFERPNPFEVSLKVGESTWAKAELQINGSKLQITTKEIVGITC